MTNAIMKYGRNFNTRPSPGSQNYTLLIFIFTAKATFPLSYLCKLLLFPPICLHWHATEFGPWTSPLLHGSQYTLTSLVISFSSMALSHDSSQIPLLPRPLSLPNSRFIYLINYSTILSEYPINLICNKYPIICNISTDLKLNFGSSPA